MAPLAQSYFMKLLLLLLAVAAEKCGHRLATGSRLQPSGAEAHRDRSFQLNVVEPARIPGTNSKHTDSQKLIEPKATPKMENTVVHSLARHPFPDFRWADVKQQGTLYCSVALFFAGILCAAGGLGGGGIYVTVLMVAGQLSPHDAVPLSKTIVFLGSLSSLTLNLKKAVANDPADGSTPLIDFNICRLVVPSALLGTLLGVMLNAHMPELMTITMLSMVLTCVACMSAKTWWKHRQEELAPMAPGAPGVNPADTSLVWKAEEKQNRPSETIQGAFSSCEVLGSFILLCLIVLFGVFRAHATACRLGILAGNHATGSLLMPESCKAPVVSAFVGQTFLSSLMVQDNADVVLKVCLAVPLCVCLAVVLTYGAYLAKYEGFSTSKIVVLCGMGFFAGGFAGLIGIGGGMVFSPFFLFIGLEPATAVATSATCIIFTSSSTTFQFLLTDRIALSLGLVYGLISMVASYAGTALVHRLREEYGAKKSYISGIVCLGVLVSVVLSVYKAVCVMIPAK